MKSIRSRSFSAHSAKTNLHHLFYTVASEYCNRRWRIRCCPLRTPNDFCDKQCAHGYIFAGINCLTPCQPAQGFTPSNRRFDNSSMSSARQLEQKKDNQFRRGAMTKGNISTVLGGSQRSHGQNFTGMVLPQRRDVPLCSSHQISNFWSRWSLFPVKSAMVHNLLVVVYTTSPDTHTFNVQPRPFADLKLIE